MILTEMESDTVRVEMKLLVMVHQKQALVLLGLSLFPQLHPFFFASFSLSLTTFS